LFEGLFQEKKEKEEKKVRVEVVRKIWWDSGGGSPGHGYIAGVFAHNQ
jgi:hypothetical protein